MKAARSAVCRMGLVLLASLACSPEDQSVRSERSSASPRTTAEAEPKGDVPVDPQSSGPNGDVATSGGEGQLARSPEPKRGEQLVGQGRDGTTSWLLYASRSGDDVCQRIDIETSTGAGGGTSCLGLPVDFSDNLQSGARIVDGSVTLEAASVVIEGRSGKTWKATPTGGGAGFGRAFFTAALDLSTPIDEVVAFAKDGSVVGRKKANSEAEDLLLGNV